MSWPTGNVPPAVTALRDMLVASATYTAAGGTQAKVDYPDKDLSAVTYPRCVIVQEDENRQVYAAGSGALPSGSLRIEYFQSTLVGDVEKEAFGIAQDIGAATTGLLIRSVRCGLASDPSPGQDAANDDSDGPRYRVANISIDFGPTL